jgi:V/A-type H+/Na+-transporting ATPase subunit D
MAERIKLNRISLREQKLKLSTYLRFLPALEARKQQLLLHIFQVRRDIQELIIIREGLINEINPWAPLYQDMEGLLPFFVRIKELDTAAENIAGLKVPRFQKVVFEEVPYSLFATPYSLDDLIARTREAVSLREEIKVLEEEERILSDGFRKTSQRINLYEKKLIPDCQVSIRKINAYLQDQRAASVGVAKVAKSRSEVSG